MFDMLQSINMILLYSQVSSIEYFNKTLLIVIIITLFTLLLFSKYITNFPMNFVIQFKFSINKPKFGINSG